ncbi:MAG: nucleoside deaminase [Pseudomonadota bacterium]
MFKSRMDEALDQAHRAASRGESPVGAILTAPDGEIIAADGNRVRELNDPTAHAEILVLRQAGRLLKSDRLIGCGLTVTLEPCPMCAGAIAHARIAHLWYGAADPKGGGVEHGARVFAHPTCHHRPQIYGGIREAECGAILRAFFEELRS